ncbi:hypothetical protein MO973_15440 [Paenibacillus sp. TRM 82003]|nr:hypothetical protein [Paenibacillus sp. TRM 82003]
MNKTRTPLAKWIAAIELLTSSNGVSALRLAEAIGVSHKAAWTMLGKFRRAIVACEKARKLEGVVHGGLRTLAPASFWLYLPDRHYRKERVVVVSASVSRSGQANTLKIESTNREDFVEGTKELANRGARRIVERTVDPTKASFVWLHRNRIGGSPLQRCFDDARRWLQARFNGIGTKYLQSYLSEFCFRHNVTAEGASFRDEWYKLCFPAAAAAIREPMELSNRSCVV